MDQKFKSWCVSSTRLGLVSDAGGGTEARCFYRKVSDRSGTGLDTGSGPQVLSVVRQDLVGRGAVFEVAPSSSAVIG